MLTLAHLGSRGQAASRRRALQDAARFSRVIVGAQCFGLRRPSAAFSRVMANCAKVGWNCHSTVSGLAGIPGTGDGVNGTGRFFNHYGLVVAANGSLVVADTYNELVRAVLVPFKLSLQVSGAAHTVTISWDAVVGKKYQVQFKEDLAAAWSNLGSPVTATNLNWSTTDNFTGANRQRIYRVLIVP